MSFSREIKEELSKQISKSRHCQMAEIAALLEMEGCASMEPLSMNLETDNDLLLDTYAMLVRRAFDVDPQKPLDETVSRKMLEALKWETPNLKEQRTNGMLLQQTCCRRAFLRGAFMAAGSISDPNTKSYHFEISVRTQAQADQIVELMQSFDLSAKVVERKKRFVVYLKEAEQIVDMLNVMEAYVALMKLENVRILKEMRNTVNRKVNCETANISKTVNAAIKQVEDIRLIEKMRGLDSLPQALREMAYLRLEYPDMPLKELGTLLDPPVGKSGVNHRLRKISAIAETLR